jgi:hypothetical protein
MNENSIWPEAKIAGQTRKSKLISVLANFVIFFIPRIANGQLQALFRNNCGRQGF